VLATVRPRELRGMAAPSAAELATRLTGSDAPARGGQGRGAGGIARAGTGRAIARRAAIGAVIDPSKDDR
jgi:hypothetical protein